MIMQRAFRRKRDREGYLQALEGQYSNVKLGAQDQKELEEKKKKVALKIFNAWKAKKN